MSKQVTLKDLSPADLDRLAAELARRENVKESTGAMNDLLRQGRGGPKLYTDGREVPPIGPRRIGER